MLSEQDQRRYLMLLCLRCSNGNVTLHETEIAFQLRISEEDWGRTKAILLDKKLVTKDNHPTSWDKRQSASDSSAERVNRHREKKKIQCNGDVTVMSRPVEIEIEIEIEKEVNPLVASKLNDVCPQREIIALYAGTLPELPQPRVWEGVRKINLTARWRWVIADLKKQDKAADRQAGLDFFRRMFGYIHESDFLMGRAGQWSADLSWIVKAENFAKIIQGNYENQRVAA